MLENFQVCDDIHLCLDKLEQNQKLAVAVREHDLNSHLQLSSQFGFVKAKTIYDYPLTFFVQRNFSHFKELNRFIQMASANGLIEKWRVDSQIRQRYIGNENGYRNLTMKHVGGFSIIWCIILILDCFVLLLERCIHKKVRGPNPSQFWIIGEMIIDADRHFWLENKRF